MASSNAQTTVVVTGASGPLGRRVVAAVARDPTVDRIVAIDRPGAELSGLANLSPGDHHHPTIEPYAAELSDPDLARALEGATAIIHLGACRPPSRDIGGTGCGPDIAGAARILELAAGFAVSGVVILSSALVYGAWPHNPVPLTEDAVLRPPPELPDAVAYGEIERLVAEWRAEHPDVAVAVLRPAITIDPDRREWFARSPWSGRGVAVEGAEPPLQYVHIDDLVAAIDLARRSPLDGSFNVAADGWLPAEQVRALAGPGRRLPLPAAAAARLTALRWRLRGAGAPPGVLSYTIHPWVVANDRLRAAGWEPNSTNEEAFVEGDRANPLLTLNAHRRQMLSLGAVGAVAALVVAAVVVLGRRRVAR